MSEGHPFGRLRAGSQTPGEGLRPSAHPVLQHPKYDSTSFDGTGSSHNGDREVHYDGFIHIPPLTFKDLGAPGLHTRLGPPSAQAPL